MTSITNKATRAPIIIKMFGKSAKVSPVDPIIVFADHQIVQHNKENQGMWIHIS